MPITIFKRGDVWHYRGTVAGRRLRGSCKTADKAIAQRVAAEAEARQWKRGFDGPEAVLTFAQAAMLYRAADKPTRFLDRVEDHWKNTLVKDIAPGAIRQAALTLFPKLSNATRNRQAIAPMQAIINHAAEAELCAHIRVKRFPVVKKEKTPATWAWVQDFMAFAPPKTAALACFLFLTGCRISEAISVEWSDVDFAKRRVLIRQGKTGGDERYAHIPQPLLVALANAPREGDQVFQYATRRGPTWAWNTAIRHAGIKHLSPHACRHGFATGLLHRRVDPITVAKRGGWKSAQHVFQTYGHAMEDETIVDVLFDTPATQTETAVPKMRKASTT